ncbi:MAG: threonylcarbamoyl-AMP synthase [Chlorobi bacterium]|nr:threonylcarbamoyl-AMP synthase [Chlorobiota bacterium]
MTRSPAETRTSLHLASSAIRRGELVAFPTETVYGLGANAFNEDAIRAIFRVKGRPADNPLIVHVDSIGRARELMQVEPASFQELVSRFWPGPLTVVVPRHAAVPDVVTAGLDTVALRMPDHHLARELIAMAGVPLVAPSANVSGQPSPTSAMDVLHDLNGKIYAVLDGGECRIGIESTVLDLTGERPVILRPGGISREDLEKMLGENVSLIDSTPDHPPSPGMKYRHYAPKAELRVVRCNEALNTSALVPLIRAEKEKGRSVGLLAAEAFRDVGADVFFSLGEGTALDYARNLYRGFRFLDKAGASIIFCPAIDEQGLGSAVMNRLLKAADIIIDI